MHVHTHTHLSFALRLGFDGVAGQGMVSASISKLGLHIGCPKATFALWKRILRIH